MVGVYTFGVYGAGVNWSGPEGLTFDRIGPSWLWLIVPGCDGGGNIGTAASSPNPVIGPSRRGWIN